MTRDPRHGPSVVEIELDLPRLVFGASLIVIAVVAAFLIGRASAPDPAPGVAAQPAGTGAAPGAVEDVSGGSGIFDALGDGGADRDPSRQVEGETALSGSWLVDLGLRASRAEAERVAGAVKRLELRPVVAGASEGGFRVAAGPFPDRARAEEAARRIEGALGLRGAVRAPAGE